MLDATILGEMQVQDENPRSTKKQEPVYAKSQFTVQELQEKVGSNVWVKCVSELEPWAGGIKMKFWDDYYITIEEAIVLDERRFAVILEEPTNKQEN